MSMTGLDVFDKTLQTTNTWLNEINEIGEDIGPDRQRAYHALMAVLTSLRDHLTVDVSAHFAAQLPLLVRGIYFHGWDPAHQPNRERSRDEFLTAIQEKLGDIRPMDPEDAARAVFHTVERHISQGAADKLKQALPKDIRQLWTGGEEFKPLPEMTKSQEEAARRRQ